MLVTTTWAIQLHKSLPRLAISGHHTYLHRGFLYTGWLPVGVSETVNAKCKANQFVHVIGRHDFAGVLYGTVAVIVQSEQHS